MPHLWGLAQPDPGQSLIEHELQGESAANLGRLGKAVEATLAALADSDAPKGSPERAALVKAAAGAVWRYFSVKPAACATTATPSPTMRSRRPCWARSGRWTEPTGPAGGRPAGKPSGRRGRS
jgi:hypothetical protein